MSTRRTEVRCSPESDTFSPLNENRQAGLVGSRMASGRGRPPVERETRKGGCLFSCRWNVISVPDPLFDCLVADHCFPPEPRVPPGI